MKTRAVSRNEQGFTLHEVLVAIVISSLLLGFGLSIFLLAQKFLRSQERHDQLTNAVDRTLFIISTDLESACAVVELSDSSLTLQFPARRFTRYTFTGEVVLRNGAPTHDKSVHLLTTLTRTTNRATATTGQQSCMLSITAEHGKLRYTAQLMILLPSSARQQFIDTTPRSS